MVTHVIYAAPVQDNVVNWKKFESLLEKSGLRIVCEKDMLPDAEFAFVYVRDPKGLLDDSAKGEARVDLISRRVRALISNWREETGANK